MKEAIAVAYKMIDETEGHWLAKSQAEERIEREVEWPIEEGKMDDKHGRRKLDEILGQYWRMK